ncbi:hypothetical protein [Roseomonas gilardii]|nr:hypothetical protein [Roseomonas gilardii]
MPAYRIRDRLDRAAVAQYRQAYAQGDVLPPLSIALVEGALILRDGWHRLEALREIGTLHTEAVISEMSGNEARWQSGKLNLTHGVRLSAGEVRKTFKAYVRAGHHKRGARGFKTYREMAADFGGNATRSSLHRWMREDFPAVARKIGGEEGGGDGSLRERSPEAVLAQQAAKHLEGVEAAMKGIKTPRLRGEVLARMAEAQRKASVACPWTPAEDETF